MAETVVSLALGIIRDLLVEEARFLSGVGNQVREVGDHLQHMQCFLKDMDKRKYEAAAFRNYINKIRDLAFRIEDVVETYAVEVTSRRGRTVRDNLRKIACVLCECTSMHNIGSNVEQIKREITSLDSKVESLNLVRSDNYTDASNQPKKRLRQTYGHEIEEDFVGMEADMNKLIKLIMPKEGDRDHRVISIYGMGGLGKTTLAGKIYNDPVVRGGFQAFAWTCVTQECNSKSVMQDVLKQLVLSTPEEKEMISRMDKRELVLELNNLQKEKKCLVVLDDIWNVADWKDLRPAFASKKANSKVLLTTRKQDVAEVGCPHKLDLLSDEEGWKLLHKKSFSGKDLRDLRIKPEQVKDIGMKIVQKCGHLPLAISALGGILSNEDSLDAWETMDVNIDSYLRRGNGDKEEEIEQVLSLSYDELPYHLKSCFLYFSHFKGDETIEVENLCLLWMAEGIVLPEDQGKEESLMDVAERYLSELANRSLVQIKLDDFRGNTKSCCLHHLMRELCLKQSVEEEFVRLMDFHGRKQPVLRFSGNTLRRLSIHIASESDDFCHDQIRKFSSQLRSIHLQVPPVEHMPTFLERVIDLENLKLLRILNLIGYYFVGNEIPKEICKLVHLRFLGLRKCRVVKLPSSIADLPFLHTLVLQSIDSVVELPNALWNMKRLRYLYLPEEHRTKQGKGRMLLGGLKELETLVGFTSRIAKIKELYELRNLRRLDGSVFGNQHLSDIINYMEFNPNSLLKMSLFVKDCDFGSKEGFDLLKKLFVSPNLFGLRISGCIWKLPHHEPDFCPKLVNLRLIESSIEEGDPMEVLEKLPKLRILSMEWGSFLGKEMTCHATGFPELRQLVFHDMLNLEKWRVEEGAMPRLLHLEISECPKLEMIPDGLKFVTTLQNLDIAGMPEEFENRVRESGQNFDKICRVHSFY